MLKLISLDARQLVRERLPALAMLVMIAACLLAFANGRATLAEQIEGRTRAASGAAEMIASTRQILATEGPSNALAAVDRAGLPVIAPLPPLVDFSAGRAALSNYATMAFPRSRAETLFKRGQLANPETLARGSLDLGFVVVWLAPLLLIGLGYGLFTADRDSGAARLILAQAGSPIRLLAARSLLRVAIIVLPVAITAVALLLTAPEMADRSEAAAAWLLTAALLLAFWWGVVLLVNSLRVSSETTALALIGLWTLFTLVLPVLIATAAATTYPPPSRLEVIAASRAAEIGATSSYENDHPNIGGENFIVQLATTRKNYMVSASVDQAIAPLIATFDQRLEQQQRITRAASYLSPALIASDALAATAGTSADAQSTFNREVVDYIGRLRGAVRRSVDLGKPLTCDQFDALPRFSLNAAPPSVLPPLVYLAALVLVLFTLALRRFSSLRPD